MATKSQQEAFIKKYYPGAVAACKGSGVFPQLAMAQAALESGWGTSKLTIEAHNFHGIKAAPGQPYVVKSTREVNNKGVSVMENAKFVKYANPTEAFKGYVAFLKQNPRYRNHGVFNATSPLSQLVCIKAAGYATDPKYVTIVGGVLRIIEQYSLPPAAAAMFPIMPLFMSVWNGIKNILR